MQLLYICLHMFDVKFIYMQLDFTSISMWLLSVPTRWFHGDVLISQHYQVMHVLYISEAIRHSVVWLCFVVCSFTSCLHGEILTEFFCFLSASMPCKVSYLYLQCIQAELSASLPDFQEGLQVRMRNLCRDSLTLLYTYFLSYSLFHRFRFF